MWLWLFYVCVCVSLTEFFFTDKNISSSPEWVAILFRKGSGEEAWFRVSRPANRELPASGNKLHREILTPTTNVSTDFEPNVAWGWVIWVPSPYRKRQHPINCFSAPTPLSYHLCPSAWGLPSVKESAAFLCSSV